jgi:NCS1 family nucleobase:cation symporter-1
VPFAFIPGQYESWGEKQLKGVDISWIIGMVAAGLIYYVLSKSIDLKAEIPAIEKSEAFLKTEQPLR